MPGCGKCARAERYSRGLPSGLDPRLRSVLCLAGRLHFTMEAVLGKNLPRRSRDGSRQRTGSHTNGFLTGKGHDVLYEIPTGCRTGLLAMPDTGFLAGVFYVWTYG